MTKDEQKQEYIRLKLSGCIDSKDKLALEYEISKEEIKPTIEQYIQNKLEITKEYFDMLQQQEGKEIQYIKSLYSGKDRIDGFGTVNKFYAWYKNQPKKCCYCGIKESDLEEYFHGDNEQYQHARQRGRVLEIERVVTAPKNKNIYNEENCRLACYICNNSKSDFISPHAFKPIARGVYNFWKEAVKITDIEFPEKSTIWE